MKCMNTMIVGALSTALLASGCGESKTKECLDLVAHASLAYERCGDDATSVEQSLLTVLDECRVRKASDLDDEKMKGCLDALDRIETTQDGTALIESGDASSCQDLFVGAGPPQCEDLFILEE